MQIYNPEAGGFVDLGVLDVTQIFGRAGRPQYDTSGEGIIITTHDKLPFYLQMLTHQMPIESNFIKALPDHREPSGDVEQSNGVLFRVVRAQ